MLMVEELRQDSTILIYKPSDADVVIGPKSSSCLAHDTFVLGIQTEAQLEMMKQGAKTIFIVDAKHKTNKYDFQLLNGCVLDEWNQGYPVAHLITSKIDEETLKYFFVALKERCPDLDINCVITDDDAALINSMNSGFGRNLRHILCKWHFDRTIQKNVKSYVPKELEEEVKTAFRTLVNAKTVEEFEKLAAPFVSTYSAQAPMFFARFYDRNMEGRKEKWAMCFRKYPHGGVDTTMHVESFHNFLKTVILKRVPNKRVDDLIRILLEIEEEFYSRRMSTIMLSTPRDETSASVDKRHHKGLSILDADVIPELEGQWKVTSQSSPGNDYVVVRCSEVCVVDQCFYRCSALSCPNLCAHLYVCSCPDSVQLCKHIHKVHSLVARESVPLPEENPQLDTLEEPVKFVSEQFDVRPTQDSGFIRDKACILAMMSQLKTCVTDCDAEKCKTMVPLMKGSLQQLVSKCKTIAESREKVDLPEMEVKVKTTSTEKLKKQVVPFRKPVKCKKKKVPANGVSQFEMKNTLLQSLDQDENEDVDNPESILNQSLDQDENEDVANPESILNQSNFSPSMNYFKPSELNKTILRVGKYEHSLVQLKSPEPVLPSVEIELQKASSAFVTGWLYDDIISSFLKILEYQNHGVMAFDPFVADSLRSGAVFKNLFIRVSDKHTLLFPVHDNGNHWVLFVFLTGLVEESKIIFYDPAGSPLIGETNLILRKMIEKLLQFFPSIQTWPIYEYKDIQTDGSSCGVHVCWVAQQVSEQVDQLVKLHDPYLYRSTIYSSLRGGCLKRESYVLFAVCGICKKYTGTGNVAVQCWRCEQLFHSSCLELSGTERTSPFSCPLA